MKWARIRAKLRHFRGHGIHSPLVYTLKREVFMKKTLSGENILLYNALTSKGIGRKTAKELQNLHNYCNFTGFEYVDSKNVTGDIRNDIFYIVADNAEGSAENILNHSGKSTLAILNGRHGRRWPGGNISIERKRYILIFKDDGLPVQTFKL